MPASIDRSVTRSSGSTGPSTRMYRRAATRWRTSTAAPVASVEAMTSRFSAMMPATWSPGVASSGMRTSKGMSARLPGGTT